MKIYTYYDNINFKYQNELIELWKLSWSRQGYDPVVLNLEDSKKNPYFETLNREMRRIYNEITGKQITDYGMSCWFRWLAYAMQDEDIFYVSDYDAINLNFAITKPSDKLHLMDADCPFLASGTPKQFNNLCKAFVEVSNEHIETIKKQANHYHDQEFFYYNFNMCRNNSAKELKNKYEILMTRDRKYIGGFYDPILKTIFSASDDLDYKKYKVAHIAHSNVGMIFDKYPEISKNYSKDQYRIIMIKNILGIK